MKKLLIVLALAAASFAQTPPIPPADYTRPTPKPSTAELQARAKAAKLKDITITYDKFRDKTQIATKPQNLIGSWEGAAAIVATGMSGPNKMQTMLLLQIGYEYQGTKLIATPPHYAIIFTSNSSNWNFVKGDRNLYILFDEHRLELEPLAADSDILFSPVGSNVTVSEKLGFGITRDDLEKILASKKAEFKLGDTRAREWKSDWSKRIRQLLDITTIK